jgi:hypothetical protein
MKFDSTYCELALGVAFKLNSLFTRLKLIFGTVCRLVALNDECCFLDVFDEDAFSPFLTDVDVTLGAPVIDFVSEDFRALFSACPPFVFSRVRKSSKTFLMRPFMDRVRLRGVRVETTIGNESSFVSFGSASDALALGMLFDLRGAGPELVTEVHVAAEDEVSASVGALIAFDEFDLGLFIVV